MRFDFERVGNGDSKTKNNRNDNKKNCTRDTGHQVHWPLYTSPGFENT
jgi:hypothetical protein